MFLDSIVHPWLIDCVSDFLKKIHYYVHLFPPNKINTTKEGLLIVK